MQIDNELLARFLSDKGLSDYYPDFSECCGLAIAEYSVDEDDGSIEFIFNNGNNKSLAYLSREILCNNLPGLVEGDDIDSLFADTVRRFDELKSNVIAAMNFMPNITELELERFDNFAVIPFENLPHLSKISLYECSDSSIQCAIKSNARDIYLYDCEFDYDTLQILMDSGIKITDVDYIMSQE